MNQPQPILSVESVHLSYRTVRALRDVSFSVRSGEIACLLGDNGAGKSSLIKILSGVMPPTSGKLFVEGREVVFDSPHDARACGVATVYQDLAVLPLLNVARNFFMGQESAVGTGVFGVDWRKAGRIAVEELARLGVTIDNPMRAVGTLSGGQRQCLAIARALYFGARVLIMDEPTASLGVKQSAAVLDLIIQAKNRGVGVVFITHNAGHAYAVGDRFTVLRRSESLGTLDKKDVTEQHLHFLMSGGDEDVTKPSKATTV